MAIPGGEIGRGRVGAFAGRAYGALEVKQFHRTSDVDSSYEAQHHTLGNRPSQAAAGNHEHRLIGIWLYKDIAGSHNSTGNYVDITWQAYKFWDKEYYLKESQSEVRVLKSHRAMLSYRTRFAGHATGRRGIRFMSDGVGQQQIELPSLGGGATETPVWDTAIGIDLAKDEIVKIQMFQNSTVNLGITQGMHVTNFKIIRISPDEVDVAALAGGGIVQQVPGPSAASRLFVKNGAW